MRTPFKTTDNLAYRAKTIGLTPIMEDLLELNIQSTIKKCKDDSDRKSNVPTLVEEQAHESGQVP